MKPEHQEPEPRDPREDDDLKLAADVADRAGGDRPASAETPIDDRDSDGSAYQQALNEIAALVALRSKALEQDTSPRPSPSESSLAEWGPFVLLERLGHGSSGEVYKARDSHLGHLVALKLFHERPLPSADLGTLLHEGRQHALVKHNNVAVIHGADEYEGRIGIWMEYIDGGTLHELVERDGSFGPSEAVNFGIELCAAMAAVHQRNLTHGDIKAQNVMREKRGRIVLMDFSSSGPAQIDDDAPSLGGTPIYMAPELFEGRAASAQSDIYALGVLLFYLVTGRHPFEAENVRELREAIKRKQPLLLEDLRPDIPRRFSEAVRKATATSPEHRFRSAGEFQRALRASQVPEFDARGLMSATTEPTSPELSPSRGIQTWLLTASVSVLIGMTAIGFLTTLCFNQALSIPNSYATEGVVDYLRWGARAMVPLITYIILRGVVVALGVGLTLVLWKLAAPTLWRRRLTAATDSLLVRLSSVHAAAIVAGSLMLGAVAVLGVNLLQFEVVRAMIEMYSADDPRSADLSPLYPSYRYFRTFAFGKVIAALMVLWLTMRYVLGRTGTSHHIAFADVGTAAMVLMACLTLTAPYRLLYHAKFEPLYYDCRPAYLLAEANGTALLYSLESLRSSQVPADDSRLVRGEERVLENIFDEWTLAQPKACGSNRASSHIPENEQEVL